MRTHTLKYAPFLENQAFWVGAEVWSSFGDGRAWLFRLAINPAEMATRGVRAQEHACSIGENSMGSANAGIPLGVCAEGFP